MANWKALNLLSLGEVSSMIFIPFYIQLLIEIKGQVCSIRAIVSYAIGAESFNK
nr:hypothetical protein [Bacillus rubiinfantis]